MAPRKSQSRIILTLCCCLALLPGAAAAQRVLAVIGSSTAAGTGPSSLDSAWTVRYTKYLATNASYIKLQNLAVGGTTTFHGLPTGTPIASGRPEADTAHNLTRALHLGAVAVIVNFPSNDTKNRYPLAEQKRNFQVMDSVARAAGVQAWFCTPQPRTELDSLQRLELIALKDWMITQFSPHVIDFWTGIAMANGMIEPIYRVTADGIHLNDAAHGVLFSRVVQAGIPATIPAPPTARALPVHMVARVFATRHFDLRGRALPNPTEPFPTFATP